MTLAYSLADRSFIPLIGVLFELIKIVRGLAPYPEGSFPRSAPARGGLNSAPNRQPAPKQSDWRFVMLLLSTVALMIYFLAASPEKSSRGPQTFYCCGLEGDAPECAAYGAYLTETIRSLMPTQNFLGPGVAQCSSQVNSRGGVAQNLCSGSSDAHRDFLRQTVSSLKLKAPPLPTAKFAQTVNFH